MALEKVSRESVEENKDQVVLDTLAASEQPSPPLTRKQALSAYFTIAAAAFGLIRCVSTRIVMNGV